MESITKQCFVLLQARSKVVLRFLAFSKKMGVLHITEICKPNVTDVDADSSLIWFEILVRWIHIKDPDPDQG